MLRNFISRLPSGKSSHYFWHSRAYSRSIIIFLHFWHCELYYFLTIYHMYLHCIYIWHCVALVLEVLFPLFEWIFFSSFFWHCDLICWRSLTIDLAGFFHHFSSGGLSDRCLFLSHTQETRAKMVIMPVIVAQS